MYGGNSETVTYNPLKLPNKIKVSSNTGTVDYIYDANGNKLAVKQGGTMKNVYCGDFVYNTSLAVDYILTPNGQLTRNPSTGAYTAQYNITDHLGNVRSRGKVPYSDAGQPRSLSEINQTWLYGIFDPISGKYIYRRENYK